MKSSVWLIATAIFLVSALVYSPSAALAEDPAPPAVGMTILEDDLSGSSLVQPFACRTQRAGRDFVGEGLRLKLTGRCTDADTATAIGLGSIRGLNIADGEIRLEVKALSGAERVLFQVGARQRPSTGTYPDADYALVEPGRGRAVIGKTNQEIAAGQREDLGGLLAADDWNTVALRLQGPNVWLLLNDQPTLFFSDPSLDRGEVFINLLRRSNEGHLVFGDDPNDTTEVAVAMRNLRISALADGDPSRAPIYQPAGQIPPPTVGTIVLEDALSRVGVLQPSTCPTGRSSGEFVGEGYLLKVRGKCRENDGTATADVRVRGLTLSDGEVRLEVKPVSAVDRVRFSLQIRAQPSGGNWYYAAVEPNGGGAQLLKLTNNQAAVLDQRFDLSGVFSINNWNTLALRAQGPILWLLLNERPILYAMTDSAYDVGDVSISLRRLDNMDDDQEAAVVVRNLRISALADADPARIPTYQRP